MNRKGPRRGRAIPLIAIAFAAGIAVGWMLRFPLRPATLSRSADVTLPVGTAGTSSGMTTTARIAASPPAAPDAPATGAAIERLERRRLRLPIDNANVDAMRGQFGDPRDAGARGHEAVDILAPRNTPVHAVDDGIVAKLFLSRQGGITIYQYDPGQEFCYYYAHLERYAAGLKEGQTVSRGDVIGYVGTSGNAPANTPHLHFAIFELTPERHWWEGVPLDPWEVFAGGRSG